MKIRAEITFFYQEDNFNDGCIGKTHFTSINMTNEGFKNDQDFFDHIIDTYIGKKNLYIDDGFDQPNYTEFKGSWYSLIDSDNYFDYFICNNEVTQRHIDQFHEGEINLLFVDCSIIFYEVIEKPLKVEVTK